MVRKNQWKKFIEARLIEAKNKGLIDQFFKLNPKTVDKTELKRLGFTGSDGDGSLVDHTSENGEDIDPEEFYSDEEDESKKFKGKRLGGVFKRETKYETDGYRKIGEVD